MLNGRNRVGQLPTAAEIGLVGSVYPSLVAAGAGSEGTPYTSADGTAGIQPQINVVAADRGGEVVLAPRRYDVTVLGGFLVSTPSIVMRCVGSAFGEDPNAEVEPTVGGKIRCTGDGLVIGNASNKLGGLVFNDLYFWGPSNTTGTIYQGLTITYSVDQIHAYNIDIQNFLRAIQVDALSDAGLWIDLDLIHNGDGFFVSSTGDISYNRILFSVIADNENVGFYVDPSSTTYGFLVLGNIFVRNARTENLTNGCAVYLGGDKGALALNYVSQIGSATVSVAGIIVNGNDHAISGNQIRDNNGAGIKVLTGSARTFIDSNTFSDNDTADVVVDAGATDTTIHQPAGLTWMNAGTRTRINGMATNAGDPGSAGDWNGVTKPDGLLIRDTTNLITWLYHASLTGGRKIIQADIEVRARRATNQSIPDVTGTTIVWNAEDYDTASAFNATTGVFTAPVAGKYHVAAAYLWNGPEVTAGKRFDLQIVKNGATAIAYTITQSAVAGGYFSSTVNDLVILAAGDTLQVDAYHANGAAVNVVADIAATYFSIRLAS